MISSAIFCSSSRSLICSVASFSISFFVVSESPRSSFCLLHLSVRFNLVISKLLAGTDFAILVPSALTVVIPSTSTTCFFTWTLATLSSCPLKLPLMIFTVSPVVTGMLLLSYFKSKFSARCEAIHFLFLCRGALYNIFLCFLGFIDFISYPLIQLLMLMKQSLAIALPLLLPQGL